MKIAFYKGFKSDKILDKIISFLDYSKYSHCEVIINGKSYSASYFDNGVREKQIDYTKHPERWDVFDLKINEEFETKQEFEKFFENTKNWKYDLIGLFLIFIFQQYDSQRTQKTYCSRWCLQAISIFKKNKHLKKMNLSPGGLFLFLKTEKII